MNTSKDWLNSIKTFLSRLGPRAKGIILLILLVALVAGSISPLFPRRVTPAAAPAGQFSGERAMVHIPVIAVEPHPTGSAAQARVRDYLVRELKASRLEVEVQRSGQLENVVARLQGTHPGDAILILTHYDTIPTTPGAGDNGAAVAVLLEIMRALASGPAPEHDVIALFDDCEEIGPFTGTRAFVREHPWMSEVRVAISLDAAMDGFISLNEAGPENNGWLVGVLADAYTGGAWMSTAGGGVYNSTPFINAGLPVITLESNYPFRQYHTPEDLPETINPATVQQMGEQTLAVVRELGNRDLSDPWGEQETYFSLPGVKTLVHYPEAWSRPLGIISLALLALALGLALLRKIISWRGVGIAFGILLVSVALSVVVVSLIQPRLPGLFGWKTYLWDDWPEVIPPTGWLAAGLLALLVLGICLGGYLAFRRWSGPADFILAGLVPFALAGVILAFAEPRAAFSLIWPALIGSLAWIVVSLINPRPVKWSLDLAAFMTALPVIIFLLPFLPGVVMSDGMKSLNILAGIEALLLAVLLPVVDLALVRQGKSLT